MNAGTAGVVATLENNGGLTRTHELADNSPAIGEGVNCPADDQRGFPRRSGLTCDIGAYELGAENLTPDVSVFTDETTEPGCTVEHCTLRERIRAAEDDDTITLGAGTYELTAGEPLDLDFLVDIEGAGAGDTTIDANGLSRVGYVAGDGFVTIEDVTIMGGDADVGSPDFTGQGGAFFIESPATLRLIETTLTENVASATGGAVSNTGNFEFIRSAAHANRVSGGGSAFGGAIYSSYSGLGTGGAELYNSTVSNNTATGDGVVRGRGGGVYVTDSTQLTHMTIAENSANDGFGGFYDANGRSGVWSTLIARNGGAECGGEMAEIVAEDYNVADDGSCLFDQPNDQEVADAGLAPLANYGGETQTHALYAGSPAIDGADADECPSVDQRLVERLPGPCDIGAFEGSIAAITVNSLGDAGDGLCTLEPGGCTLREAVTATDEDTVITLPAGDYVLTDGALPLGGGRSVVGAGARTTSITASTTRVVTADSGPASLSGVSVFGGDAGPAGQGGGIYVGPSGDLDLSASTVASNEAMTGGGIYSAGDLTVERSSVVSNDGLPVRRRAEAASRSPTAPRR